jgi:membrane associated rhomboid family serine protease
LTFDVFFVSQVQPPTMASLLRMQLGRSSGLANHAAAALQVRRAAVAAPKALFPLLRPLVRPAATSTPFATAQQSASLRPLLSSSPAASFSTSSVVNASDSSSGHGHSNAGRKAGRGRARVILHVAGGLVLMGATATGTAFVLVKAFELDEERRSSPAAHLRQYGNLLLSPSSEGVWDRVRRMVPTSILAILGVNLAVFGLHRILPTAVAYKHLFTSYSHLHAKQYHTLLTAAFSHHGAMHLLANCWALFVFGPKVCGIIGETDFVAIYLVAGVLSSYAAVRSTRWIGSARLQLAAMSQPSLGASGAVCTVVGMSAVLFPFDKYSLLGVTPWIKAEHLVPGFVMFDIGGVAYMWLRDRLSGIGHVAHVSGVLFGYFVTHTYLKHFNARAARRLKVIEQQRKLGLENY